MKKYISPCALLIGVLTLVASVFVGYYFVPYKIRENVMQQSQIVLGNKRFKNWEKIPVPLFQNIYFFNVTNAAKVVRGEKPILQEIGPYVYQQKRRKFDIVFNEQNDTIFYKERTDYYFRPDLSNGSESDMLTFINLPYVGTASKGAKAGIITRYLITDTLNNYSDQELYMNITVGDLLFNGYYVPFIKDLSELNGGEEIFPNNTFGLYYGKNGSDNGRFEIYSGVKYPEKFGNVVSWNSMPQLNWWDDEYCNRINGSDGANFQPFLTKERNLDMFIPGLCKSFRFKYDSDGMDVKGIPVLKYSIPPSFFESAKTNPDNACYCTNPGEDYENCPESGVFQMAGCGKGVMMLSQPHFYQGSYFYVNQSVGLNPDKERHEMALYVESYTSAPARLKLRFQMNVDLQPIKFLKPLKKIPRMVHPLFWIDQSVEIPEDSAITLRDKLYGTVSTVNLLTHVGIIVGSVLIVLSLLCFFLCSSSNTAQNGESKIECVSYHPKGTLSNGKVAFTPINGNGTITYNESSNANHDLNSSINNSPLLKSNGDLPARMAARNPERVQISTSPSGEDHVPNPCLGSNIQQQSSPAIQMDCCVVQPDSRLSPFPTVADYSSNLSVATDKNTLKDIVEATSSYENL